MRGRRAWTRRTVAPRFTSTALHQASMSFETNGPAGPACGGVNQPDRASAARPLAGRRRAPRLSADVPRHRRRAAGARLVARLGRLVQVSVRLTKISDAVVVFARSSAIARPIPLPAPVTGSFGETAARSFAIGGSSIAAAGRPHRSDGTARLVDDTRAQEVLAALVDHEADHLETGLPHRDHVRRPTRSS